MHYKLCEEELIELHGRDILAVLVYSHVAGSNFVDEHYGAVGSITELELDVIQLHALFLQVISNDLGDLLSLSLQGVVLLGGHNADSNQSVLGDQGIALLVVLEGGLNVGGQVSAGLNKSAVAADKAADSLVAADNFETLAEYLGREDFHSGVSQICTYIVGLDACCVDLLEEIDGHSQVNIANALDSEADGILAGIEYAVLAGAVVLELEQVVAVIQLENILGLSGINKIHK